MSATLEIVRNRRGDDGEQTTLIRADRVVAAATVRSDPHAVYLHVDLAGGHRPTSTGRELLDAVFAAIEPGPARPVHASVPIGAPDLLAGLRDHLVAVETRPAGASCLVDAVLPAVPR